VNHCLEKNVPEADKLEILADGFENSDRKVELLKVPQFMAFLRVDRLLWNNAAYPFIRRHNIPSLQKLLQSLPEKPERKEWINIGGQLIPKTPVQTLLRNIRSGKINGWDDVHAFNSKNSRLYQEQKLQHAFASLL